MPVLRTLQHRQLTTSNPTPMLIILLIIALLFYIGMFIGMLIR